MKNLLVVEDNKTVRQGLADLFKKNKEFGVSGTYGDLQAALADSRALHPDLIVLDLKLPDVRGTEAISGLREKYPEAKVVVYTAYENENEIIACMMAGANGYIMKDTPPARFLSELEVIAQGGSTLTPRVAEKILRHFAPHKATESSLSKRELQVLNLISLGLRYEDIAEELDISVHTVRHHIEKIYKKLNVTSRGQAVAQAVRAGIIRLE
ncbi:MAG TPA: response regulator transcription factor [Turneriella sp.]|nr:response regulator transcription factor [Turneriella sp.]HNE18842.1 response regulator transcription factor [Turneriella sp.]HNJ64587.1 response regulator transcription factor [Turneriella sp.]HNL09314.1 response regulator transcription factor [Turneriella sp.]HNL53191.1 response regulator transcription factor [Turneriella sp.]